jgi:hypothetical protein
MGRSRLSSYRTGNNFVQDRRFFNIDFTLLPHNSCMSGIGVAERQATQPNAMCGCFVSFVRSVILYKAFHGMAQNARQAVNRRQRRDVSRHPTIANATCRAPRVFRMSRRSC